MQEYVLWEDVHYFVDYLAEYLRKGFIKNLSGVYGVPRGGLCIAVMLSHKLDIPLLLAPDKNCLVVDDIADTGVTLEHYASKHYSIATMYYHKQSKVKPSLWWKEKTDKWIVFPWEE